jgi:predicted glycogen debranching enzyme
MNHLIDFNAAQCRDFQFSGKREWLVTNGIGGYAMGTIAGNFARHYHGLLIAPLEPPLVRYLLLVRLGETINYQDRAYALYTDHTGEGALTTAGYQYIERFYLDHGVPVWVYAVDDLRLEKRLWMEPKQNTTYVRYRVLEASAPVELSLGVLVNERNYHASTSAGDLTLEVEKTKNGLRVKNTVTSYVFAPAADVTIDPEWRHGYYKAVEAYRGEPIHDDHLHAGTLRYIVTSGDEIILAASIEPTVKIEGAYERYLEHDAAVLRRSQVQNNCAEIEQLIRTADQFIVQRATPADPQGVTIIAGYPWFTDWGRDTMISLPGLALAIGRLEDARKILQTFIQYVDAGMIPNRFPDEGEEPEYNTVDATLWFFEAVRIYFEQTKDETLLRDFFPTLQSIINWHVKGTRYEIRVDPSDGLLSAGEPDVQLTWMDAKFGDWVVTPRNGKAVEINALWYNALRSMANFARHLDEDAQHYDDMATRARESFARFWNDDVGYCYDVIDTPDGNDPTLRPNQLLAISLHHADDLLTVAQQQAVVETCERHLLTPRGLRSLAPEDEQYIGHYGGDRMSRDGAYHQGTVWSWLIGPFISAHLRVYDDQARVLEMVENFFPHLSEHGLGSISEIFDGDAPHIPRGCVAQAWGVAELLRVWQQLT